MYSPCSSSLMSLPCFSPSTLELHTIPKWLAPFSSVYMFLFLGALGWGSCLIASWLVVLRPSPATVKSSGSLTLEEARPRATHAGCGGPRVSVSCPGRARVQILCPPKPLLSPTYQGAVTVPGTFKTTDSSEGLLSLPRY